MASNGAAFWIAHTTLGHVFHGSLCPGHELLNESIIGLGI